MEKYWCAKVGFAVSPKTRDRCIFSFHYFKLWSFMPIGDRKDVSDYTFPVCHFFVFSNYLCPTQSSYLRAPAILHSSSYRRSEICRKRKKLTAKRKKKKEKKEKHRRVSNVCPDSIPEAALSNDPDSLVPGRDYPNSQLWSHHREEVRTVRSAIGWMEVVKAATWRVWGRRLTHFLSLSHSTGMLGSMTNPKTPASDRGLAQFIHTLGTGAHFITSPSSSLHTDDLQPAICSLFTSLPPFVTYEVTFRLYEFNPCNKYFRNFTSAWSARWNVSAYILLL